MLSAGKRLKTRTCSVHYMEELIVREQSKPSQKYGCYPDERPLSQLLDFGYVVVDKPAGPTSHQVSAYVQQILGIDKSGHGGTLDPKVTGVLEIGTGVATRLMEYGLKAGKQYIGIMHLHADVPEHEVRQAAQKFIGIITQLPPKRSAVARRKRERTIHDLQLLEVSGRDVLFLADVQAGTYIRKLCHDLGAAIGCGAHMASLRRTRAGNSSEEQAITLQELADYYSEAKEGREEHFREVFLPAEALVEHLPIIAVLDSAVHSLTHGATLKMPGISLFSQGIREGDRVQILTLKGELVAIATAGVGADGLLADSGVAARMDKVFMSSDVYPRME